MFINRNPRYFEYVLDYLRNGGQLPPNLPASIEELDRIREEFEYFLLPCVDEFGTNRSVRQFALGWYTVRDLDFRATSGYMATPQRPVVSDKYLCVAMDTQTPMPPLPDFSYGAPVTDENHSIEVWGVADDAHRISIEREYKVYDMALHEDSLAVVTFRVPGVEVFDLRGSTEVCVCACLGFRMSRLPRCGGIAANDTRPSVCAMTGQSSASWMPLALSYLGCAVDGMHELDAAEVRLLRMSGADKHLFMRAHREHTSRQMRACPFSALQDIDAGQGVQTFARGATKYDKCAINERFVAALIERQRIIDVWTREPVPTLRRIALSPTLQGHRGIVLCCSYLVCHGDDARIDIYDLMCATLSNTPAQSLTVPGNVERVRISPDGARIVVMWDSVGPVETKFKFVTYFEAASCCRYTSLLVGSCVSCEFAAAYWMECPLHHFIVASATAESVYSETCRSPLKHLFSPSPHAGPRDCQLSTSQVSRSCRCRT